MPKFSNYPAAGSLQNTTLVLVDTPVGPGTYQTQAATVALLSATVNSGTPPVTQGLITDTTFAAAETISGGRAVAFTQSGLLQIAMASVSGRMPAVGVAQNNYASGANVSLVVWGECFNVSSGTPFNFSGWVGQPVFIGASGHLIASGAPSASGNITQSVGTSVSQSGLFVEVAGAMESVIAGSGDVGSGTITGQAGGGAFCIASGTVGRYDLASGCVIDLLPCEETISGVRAVAWGSGGCFVVNAQRASGLRVPVIGVAAGNYLSGSVVQVVRRGIVGCTFSGAAASGFFGQFLYLGSGGLIINQSGFMGGASSGLGAAPTPSTSGGSGYLVQRVGVSVSGGLDVQLDGNLTSGLISGLLGAW